MKTVASHKLSALLWIFILHFCVQTPAFSQSVLNYQGRVISGGTAFNGTGQFKFAIVSADGSTFHWKNDGTTTAAAPATAVSLPVNKGLFSVQLGDSAIVNMGTIKSTVFSNAGLKLRVWFNDGLKNWQQFSPDQTLNLNTSSLKPDPKAILLFQDYGSSGYWNGGAPGEFYHSGYALLPQDTEKLICHTRIHINLSQNFFDFPAEAVGEEFEEIELTVDFGGEVLKQIFRRETNFFADNVQDFSIGKVPPSGIVKYESWFKLKTKQGQNFKGVPLAPIKFHDNTPSGGALSGYLIITTVH